MFTDSFINSFTQPIGSWLTERTVMDTELESQVDIGSAQIVNSPIFLIVTHQTAAGIGVPSKGNIIAVFGNLRILQCSVEINGVRFPKQPNSFNYAASEYLDQ